MPLPLFQMLLKQEAVKLPHSFPPIATTWKAQHFEMCLNIGFIHLNCNLGHRVIKVFLLSKADCITVLWDQGWPILLGWRSHLGTILFLLTKKYFISGFLDFAALEVLILEDQNRDLGEYISSPTWLNFLLRSV